MTGVPDRGEGAFVCRDPEGDWIEDQLEDDHAYAEHLKESREMEAWKEAKYEEG